jgi:hypothetical protein
MLRDARAVIAVTEEARAASSELDWERWADARF